MYDITAKENTGNEKKYWNFIEGQRQGCSPNASGTNYFNKEVVWNMPFDVKYQSKSPFGWPQIVVSVIGYDFFGKSYVEGYGCTHIPATAGTYILY